MLKFKAHHGIKLIHSLFFYVNEFWNKCGIFFFGQTNVEFWLRFKASSVKKDINKVKNLHEKIWLIQKQKTNNKPEINTP